MEIARRDLLAAGAAATATGLAGCVGSGCTHSATLQLTRARDGVLVERFSKPVATRTLGPAGRRLAETAIERGATSYRAGRALVEDGLARHDGNFYRLASSVTGTSTVRGYRFEAEFRPRPTGTRTAPDRTVAFADLPRVDRRALLYGALNEIGRRIVPADAGEGGRGSGPATLLYPTGADREASVLVPEPEYDAITYEGYLLRLSDGEVRTDATLRTVELRAEEVAGSPAAFADHVVGTVLDDPVRLDEGSLTADQREIVEAAIDEEFGDDACLDDDSSAPAFRALVTRLFETEEELKHASPEGPRLVVYDGRRYLASYGVSVA